MTKLSPRSDAAVLAIRCSCLPLRGTLIFVCAADVNRVCCRRESGVGGGGTSLCALSFYRYFILAGVHAEQGVRTCFLVSLGLRRCVCWGAGAARAARTRRAC